MKTEIIGNTQQEWLDTKEASRFMGLRPQTLYNWRFQGIGPAYTVISSRAIRYHIDDLHRYMDARRVVPGERGAA